MVNRERAQMHMKNSAAELSGNRPACAISARRFFSAQSLRGGFT
jgi:hypothetical protein